MNLMLQAGDSARPPKASGFMQLGSLSCGSGRAGRQIALTEYPVAGLQSGVPRPIQIVLHRQSKLLEIIFDDGKMFRLPCELLRVYSPSAEVRGHGPGQEVLQTGKREVGIEAIEPVGNYAVRLVFSDGHDTGLYSWDYLYSLGENQETLWRQYLERLEKAGGSREASASPQGPKPGWKKL